MMQRYVELKEKYQDCLVFYRLGDFYEMFFDDAKIASKELQLALTGRDCGLSERAPMCGVPHHSVNTYINKLLEKNYKVAICEQLTDPKESKGLVERDVIRVITPGTVIEDDLLSAKTNNFLAAVFFHKGVCGVAWADVSTGEFNMTDVPAELELSAVTDKLIEIRANEILADPAFFDRAQRIPEYIRKQFKPLSRSDALFADEANKKKLAERFPDAAGQAKKHPAAWQAAAGLWAYLILTQKNTLAHMTQLTFLDEKSTLVLDASAVRNLELFRSMGDHGTRGTLLWLMDRTLTPMGARKLHAWMERPLRRQEEILLRLDAVEELKNDFARRQDMIAAMTDICDIERICTRISYGTVNAREALFMRRSLEKLPALNELLSGTQSALLQSALKQLDPLEDLCALLTAA
ncbi:MAG: DNA mismatch repair protein MutS, partial [Clostridia bacterium]|nr:DNA mismatch repair protein MutS [Clostridia bacterium]